MFASSKCLLGETVKQQFPHVHDLSNNLKSFNPKEHYDWLACSHHQTFRM